MSVTAIIGAQLGSEGKGVVSAALASRFDVAVRVGGPNAGHSFRRGGRTYKMRSIPCAWVNPECDLIIGPGAVVDPELLARELNEIPSAFVTVDSAAAVVTHEDADAEVAMGLWEAVGSTTEGVMQARIRKMERDGRRRPLARDYDQWHHRASVMAHTSDVLAAILRDGGDVMLEGTQGSGLSLHHGTWPFVTTADTNVSGIASDAGIAPADIEHVFLVARTLPIRVAGNSGPMGRELDWVDLAKYSGVLIPERTTVTNRIRRISEWDDGVFDRAVRLNSPCGVFLMFADYLAPEAAGTTDEDVLFAMARDLPYGHLESLTEKIETGGHQRRGVPIVAYGTGGPDWALAWRGTCSHGLRWGPEAATVPA